MDSNIPKIIFYSSLVGVFLRIGRSTLLFEDFLPKAKDLIKCMFKQGARHQISHRMLLKIVSRYTESFSQFRMEDRDLIERVFEEVLKNKKSQKNK